MNSRWKEAYELKIAGKSIPEIAQHLSIAEKTAYSYISEYKAILRGDRKINTEPINMALLIPGGYSKTDEKAKRLQRTFCARVLLANEFAKKSGIKLSSDNIGQIMTLFNRGSLYVRA